MIEEVIDSEKGARKARLKTRFLWILIILNIILLGYAAYEVIMIVISLLN